MYVVFDLWSCIVGERVLLAQYKLAIYNCKVNKHLTVESHGRWCSRSTLIEHKQRCFGSPSTIWSSPGWTTTSFFIIKCGRLITVPASRGYTNRSSLKVLFICACELAHSRTFLPLTLWEPSPCHRPWLMYRVYIWVYIYEHVFAHIYVYVWDSKPCHRPWVICRVYIYMSTYIYIHEYISI